LIEINLLPSGAGKRPAAGARKQTGRPSLPSVGADPRVAGVGGVAVLLLLLAGFWLWTSGSERDTLASRIEEQAADSVRLERAIELMRTLDTRRDTIDQKMDVIRQVDTRRYIWPHLMDEVSRATPPFMWLTRMASTSDEGPPPAAAPAAAPAPGAPDAAAAAADPAAPAPAPQAVGPSFTLEGHAGSTEALTRFMRNLEASPMIRDVALVTSQQETVQGRAVLKFTVEARWEDPDPAFIETVPLLTAR
jgi:Tfp pilus assembly protein PilN